MQQLAVDVTRAVRGSSTRRFLVAITAATFVPWLLLPFFAPPEGRSPLDLRLLIFVAGAPHVLSTLALYFDPGMRPLVAAKRGRFVYAPIVLLVTVPLLYGLGSTRVVSIAVVAAGGWAAYHFSRQNLGVLSFVYAGRGLPSPTRWERDLLGAVGIVGVIGVVGAASELTGANLVPFGAPLRQLAALAMAAILIAAAPAVWRRRHDALSCLFLVESLLFFAPFLFFGGKAAVPYGVAHGLQYLVFMAFLVAHRPAPTRAPVRALVIAGLAIPALGGLAYHVARQSGVPALIGVLAAATFIHFVMDASIWRLREPVQRRYALERFPFLER